MNYLILAEGSDGMAFQPCDVWLGRFAVLEYLLYLDADVVGCLICFLEGRFYALDYFFNWCLLWCYGDIEARESSAVSSSVR